MSIEIKTLIKLRKIQKKKYGNESKGLVPKLVEFGMLVTLSNHERTLFCYYIMNRFEITLLDQL
jgi:hypothetical protein